VIIMQTDQAKNPRKDHKIPGPFYWIPFILPLLLGSCVMVGPDYQGMEPHPAQQKWQAEMEKGLNQTRPDKDNLASWWKEVFDDPLLVELQKRAAEGNLDLNASLSRIREARSRMGMSRASLFPGLDAQGAAKRRRSSENMGTQGGGEINNYYNAGFDATWELDIFGGTRRSVQAARAELQATRAGLKDVLTTLMADVALNYIQVRTYQQRLQILRSNIETLKQTYELNKSSYQSGIIDELALQQSLRNLEESRSRTPRIKTGLKAAKHRLCVLLGLEPGQLESELDNAGPIPDIPSQVAVGIPAESLRRRPDIQKAERKLAAQTAKIGVATAKLYPRFNLAGSIGLESIDSGDFLGPDSRIWSVGPGINWRIFHAGSLRMNIRVKTEQQKQALVQYKSTVLRAREEVENALTAYAKEKIRLRDLKNSVAAAKRTEELARDRYQSGLVDFYKVLESQRSLLSIQDKRVQSKGEVAANLVRLYKALGGGWKFYDQLLEKRSTNPKDKE